MGDVAAAVSAEFAFGASERASVRFISGALFADRIGVGAAAAVSFISRTAVLSNNAALRLYLRERARGGRMMKGRIGK